jgi:hypothetical protein
VKCEKPWHAVITGTSRVLSKEKENLEVIAGKHPVDSYTKSVARSKGGARV